jgi:hypothetical protein
MTVGCPTLIYGVVKLFGKLRSAMVPHCRLVSAFPLAFEIPAGEHCRRHLAALVPARDRDTLRQGQTQLQYRDTVRHQRNGCDWTVEASLTFEAPTAGAR